MSQVLSAIILAANSAIEAIFFVICFPNLKWNIRQIALMNVLMKIVDLNFSDGSTSWFKY